MNWKTNTVFLALLAATVLSGILQGDLTKRWKSQDNHSLVPLASIPAVFGPWEMKTDLEITEQVDELLEAKDWLNRTYRNRDTGEVVSLAIVAGSHGPISVHVPEICYSSKNYQERESRKSVPLADNSFWRLVFETKNVHQAPMAVWYAWSTGDAWESSASPRHEFAGVPVLYKIQLSGIIPAEGGGERDPCEEFLNDFLSSEWPLTD